MRKTLLAIMLTALAAGAALAQPGDVTNAMDPAGLARLPGYVIQEYAQTQAGQVFHAGPAQPMERQGRRTILRYELRAGAQPAGAEAILAHYAGLAQGLGGRAVYVGETADAVRQGTYQVPASNGEIWLRVDPSLDGSRYDLVVVEPAGADPEGIGAEMLRALDKDGRVALYLDFDPGRAELKPEAGPVLEAVAALLAAHPGLRLGVEGHTDDRGGAEANQRLSLARAQAVVGALVQAGVAPDRLAAKGWGQARPLMANDTREGRAQNSRVELVRP